MGKGLGGADNRLFVLPEALFAHSISSEAFCISIVLKTLPLTCGLSCILFHGVKASFNNLAVLFGCGLSLLHPACITI